MNRKSLLIVCLCLLLIIPLILVFTKHQKKNEQGITPNNTYPTAQVTEYPLPYTKTAPGKTTEDSIKNIPGYTLQTTLSDGTNVYAAASVNALKKNIIQAKNGTVTFEKAITISAAYVHPKISELTSRLGKPQAEVTGSKEYGAFERYYIYADKGITLVGNPDTDELDEIQYYTPTTVDNYRANYGADISPSSFQEKFGQ